MPQYTQKSAVRRILKIVDFSQAEVVHQPIDAIGFKLLKNRAFSAFC